MTEHTYKFISHEKKHEDFVVNTNIGKLQFKYVSDPSDAAFGIMFHGYESKKSRAENFSWYHDTKKRNPILKILHILYDDKFNPDTYLRDNGFNVTDLIISKNPQKSAYHEILTCLLRFIEITNKVTIEIKPLKITVNKSALDNIHSEIDDLTKQIEKMSRSLVILKTRLTELYQSDD